VFVHLLALHERIWPVQRIWESAARIVLDQTIAHLIQIKATNCETLFACLIASHIRRHACVDPRKRRTHRT
jgi:hypothetical protein